MTGLAAAIRIIAEKYAKENNLDFIPAEYWGLGCISVMHNKELISEDDYEQSEYEKLAVEINKISTTVDEEKLKTGVFSKEYEENDRKIAKGLVRRASVGNYNSIDIIRYVIEESDFDIILHGDDHTDYPASETNKHEHIASVSENTDNRERPDTEKGAVDDEKEIPKLSDLLKTCNALRGELLTKIYGQDYAIKQFVEGFFRGEMDAVINSEHKGPRAIFLFAGSPGVGKTFLAETAAKIIGREFRRFDMSSFSDSATIGNFSGTAQEYKAAKEGDVTGFVKKNPTSIILFDEIEKAYKQIILQFLQILDRGKLQDAYTQQDVDFTKTIVIFTTNAGKQLYSDKSKKKLSATPKNIVLDALEKDINPETCIPYFPQAIISRLSTGNVIMFNHLSAGNLMKITAKELNSIESNVSDCYNLRFESGNELIPTILYTLGGSADGRNASSAAKIFFNAEFQELLRNTGEIHGIDAVDNIKCIKWLIDVDSASDDIKRLYKREDSSLAIVFAAKEYNALEELKLSHNRILVTDDLDAFHRTIVSEDPDTIFIDYYLGATGERQNSLNSEDISSKGRDAFFMVQEECRDSLIYILETSSHKYNEEEKLSLTGRGATDIIALSIDKPDTLRDELEAVFMEICYQKAIDYLASHHQILSYETAQRIVNNNMDAEIELFDLKLIQAYEAEDQKQMMSASNCPDVHWDDIVVSDKLKDDLKYAIEFMQNPKKYNSTGASMPKGMLLFGPPGTGKTSLAKVVATESNVNFIEISSDEFTDKYVGEGPRKVHEVFNRARKYAPAVLFIDEIDVVGSSRDSGSMTQGIHDVLNAILTELDGFKTSAKKPIFVMAATNLKESLDKALLSRFDQKVEVDLPGRKERAAIFELHKCKKPDLLKISQEEIDNLANRSIGQSPRDIVNVINGAIKDAHTVGLTEVTDEIIDNAYERYISGEGKPWTDKEVERVAVHESGHTLVNVLLGNKPSYLTIVSRGDHGGYMQHGDADDKHISTRQQLLDDVCCSLGGRAAELIHYGDDLGVTTGASGDLSQATKMLRNMICAYGMYEDVGLMSESKQTSGKNAPGGFSPETEAVIEKKINELLDEQLERAKKLISDNDDKMKNLLGKLKDKQYLTEKEILSVIDIM